jgi:O-antigen/teichoic acid export membrane protein
LDAAALRYIPQYASRGEWGYCRGIIRRSYQIAFPVGVLLFLGASGVVLAGRHHLTEENLTGALLIGLAALPLWTAIKLTQGILQALKRPGFSQFLDGVLAPALLLAMLGAAVAMKISVSAITAMAAFAVSCLAVLLFGAVWLRSRVLSPEVKAAGAEYNTREWLRFALPMLLIAGTHVIMGNTDVIMIGMMMDTSRAGIYSAAARLASLVAVSLVFVNMALTPYIVEYFFNERRVELQNFISLSVRIAALFAVPFFFVLMIYGKPVLGLFGEEFKSGYQSLLILIVGQLVNALSGSVGYIMVMTGKQKQAGIVFAVSAALNIILNLILIPLFGIAGAAVATAVSMILWNVTLVVYIRNRLYLNSTIFSGMKSV